MNIIQKYKSIKQSRILINKIYIYSKNITKRTKNIYIQLNEFNQIINQFDYKELGLEKVTELIKQLGLEMSYDGKINLMAIKYITEETTKSITQGIQEVK